MYDGYSSSNDLRKLLYIEENKKCESFRGGAGEALAGSESLGSCGMSTESLSSHTKPLFDNRIYI